jgi:hypothetical protein
MDALLGIVSTNPEKFFVVGSASEKGGEVTL